MKFKEELIVLLDENDLDQIVHKQWISTGRSTLETFCVPPEEFHSYGASCILHEVQDKSAARKNFGHGWFGISAEWHFSATLHGKGSCDGLGGTVKRLGARASLQRPYNDQIMWFLASCLIGHPQLCHLFTLAIAAWKIMKENSIFMSDAFTNLAQFHVQENCSHLFPSQTLKLESVTIQLLTLPCREERGYSKNKRSSTRINCWFCRVLVWWKVVLGLSIWNHPGRQSGKANISSSTWAFQFIQISRNLGHTYCTNG